MNFKEQNILYFTRTMKMGGTENVILQLCEIFKPLVNKIIVCSCGGVNVEMLQEMGIKHYEIPDMEEKKPRTMFKIASKVKAIVKEEKITIIHTHHRMAAFYVSILKLYKKCRFLNTSHNTFKNKKILTRVAYKHAKLIACGDVVKENLFDSFGLRDVTVVHNAVKPFEGGGEIEPLIERLHNEGCYVIGNVGRLSKQKGMEYYIEAIADIVEMHPETRFLVIGSGEDEQKLRALVCQLNLEKMVFFMGYRADVQNIISQIDLIVLSSLWEGFPLTPIEAFSVGKTIIATAVDGTVEIVKNQKNGLLIEPKDSKQISDKVCWMIDHPKEKKKMEEEALQNYLDEFSMGRFAKGYIGCYENA